MTSIGFGCRISVVRRIAVRMSSTNSTYEDAIQKLNSLQSNKSTIEQIKKGLKTGQKCTNLADMENYLQRVGIPLSKLDELSVIHVAGTKGKGSTSAMCESILRHHGFRTGFYSSPHLVAARERVRLDGRPLAQDAFATYLHEVYGMLWDTREFEGDMPKYFAFLTVLAFHVFLRERVDVALVEVGIGGIVDYTNVLRKVPVVGVTALGLDHTAILGASLPEIAAAKAGVMKPASRAYTVPQPADAMDVLLAKAASVKCPLTIVPDYSSYAFPSSGTCYLPVDLDAYRTNASLAIQLSHAWMRITQANTKQNGVACLSNKGHNGLVNGHSKIVNGLGKPESNGVTNGNFNSSNEYKDKSEIMTNGDIIKGENSMTSDELDRLVYEIPRQTAEGLRQCRWPGRYQMIKGEYANFYLDGAHTKESMEICAQWFTNSDRSDNKTLIFSATGDRNAEILLQPLTNIPFKQVYFVIPTANKVTAKTNDNYSLVEQEELIQRCKNHAKIWSKINSTTNVTVLECVADALCDISKQEVKPSVLITGSLHLVGAALSILDPSLSN